MPVIGIGTDVHPFDPINDLYLAGLHWPGEPGLAGHSDGDVVAHACCDAVLSAAGLGDLGSQFGTDDPKLAGASGATLLAETVRRVRDAGFEIGNIAVQLIGNKPKLGPRRDEAEAALSAAAGAGSPCRQQRPMGWASLGEARVSQRLPRHYSFPRDRVPSDRGVRHVERQGARSPIGWT